MKKLRPTIPTKIKETVTDRKFSSVDDLPFTLSVKDMASALGLSQSKTYQLMSTDDFPRLVLGRRVIVRKDSFIEWMQANTR